MSLRKIEEKDLELILSWRNHPIIRQSMFQQDTITIEAHRAWFHRESEKSDACWLIYSNESDTPSGVIYCTNIDTKNRHGFWGFYTAPDAPKGTGTAMCKEAINYFFDALELKKINAEVIESNQRSHSFHKKMGFNVEGVFIEHYKSKFGYESVTRYALIKKNK